MGKFFIDRPVFAIVIALVILIAGGLSIYGLPIAQYPNITPPTIQVTANYPGADAETLAQSVAIPIEEQVNGAEGMIYMSSTCTNDGRYSLVCTFEVGRDPDMANVDINNRVNKAMAKLPSDVVSQGISIKKQSPNMLMVISVYSPDKTYDEIFLSNYANNQMVDAIARTSGVGSTQLVGQRDYAMRLWVNPEKLSKLGLIPDDLIRVVNDQNVLAPAGSVGQPPAKAGNEFQFTVNAKGRLSTEEEFGNMIVRSQDDSAILRMKDVARVELAAYSYSNTGRLSGMPATLILIYQDPGANAITTADKLRKLLEEMKTSMPQGLDYEITLDTTDFVKTSIEEVLETLRDAIILVIIVVFIFLGSFRATFIPMLAVPVSLIGTFALFGPLGFSINTLTLFGIVLAVGIVVDDAIVVVEAVEKHIEDGHDPKEATRLAMDDVQGPVIAIALVLCAVFIPVAFMGGITGQLYKQFALTLSVSVVLSAIVALTLTPALCTMILKKRDEKKNLLTYFNMAFNFVFGKVTNVYVWSVKKILRLSLVFILLLFCIWGGAGYFLKILPTGFVPNEDQGYFFIAVTLPDGASLDRTDALSKRSEEFIMKLPGVKRVMTMGGLNILNNTYNSNTYTIVVTLEPWDERKSKEKSIKTIMMASKKELDSYPEATAMVVLPPPIPGLGSAGGVQFELQDRSSHTPEELDKVTQDFMAQLRKRPELMMVYTGYRTSLPQINLDLDRDKTSNMGISISSVFRSLQVFLGGYPINDFNLFDRTYKVMIQAEAEFRGNAKSISRIYVRTSDGDMVPLSTLATVNETSGPSLIQRYNLYRNSEIIGVGKTEYSSGQIMKAIEDTAAKYLPPGYGYEWSGTSYQEKMAGSAQSMIFVLALVFVFLFLAAQYESWAVPFSVLFGLPIGILGAFYSLWLLGVDDNVYAQIGLVMLLGLAAKNAILIVEFAKERYEHQGMSLFDATVEGSRLRLRPILMTSFAFILGVLPLVIASGAGAGSRHSLGTAVFGGMIFATSLGVFFIPLLYVVVQSIAEFFGGKRKKDKKAAEISKQLTDSTAAPEESVKEKDAKSAQSAKESTKPVEPVKEKTKPAESAKDNAKPVQPLQEKAKPLQVLKEKAKPAQPVKENAKPVEAVKEKAKPMEAAPEQPVKEKTKPVQPVKESDTKPMQPVKEKDVKPIKNGKTSNESAKDEKSKKTEKKGEAE